MKAHVRKKRAQQTNKRPMKNIDSLLSYFVTEAAAYIFVLTEMDGGSQQSLLGLTRLHYVDRKLAKTWRAKIRQVIGDHEAANAELDRICITLLP